MNESQGPNPDRIVPATATCDLIGKLRSRSCDVSTADHQTIEKQQQHGSEESHHPASGLAFPVEPERAADETAQHGASDTEQYRDDDPAGIPAGITSFASAPTTKPKRIQPRIVISVCLPPSTTSTGCKRETAWRQKHLRTL